MGHMGYNLYGYYNLLPARELIWQKVEEEVHSWFQHVANRSILKSFHSSFRPPLPFCMLYVLLTATCNLSPRPLFTSGINWEPKTRSVSLKSGKPNAMATAQEDGGLIQITLLFISPLGHQPTALLVGQNFKGYNLLSFPMRSHLDPSLALFLFYRNAEVIYGNRISWWHLLWIMNIYCDNSKEKNSQRPQKPHPVQFIFRGAHWKR